MTVISFPSAADQWPLWLAVLVVVVFIVLWCRRPDRREDR